MPNLPSAKKKMRRDERRRLHNRYYRKTVLNFAKSILKNTNITEVREKIKQAYKMLDKLGARRIIHPNKAARWKSKLMRHLNKLEKAQTQG